MRTKNDCMNKLMAELRPLIKNHIHYTKLREIFENTINYIRDGTVKDEKLFRAEIRIEELRQEIKEIKHERSEYKSCLNLIKKQI